MSTRNRMANLNNRYQGTSRKVLAVCSAGMLRSPTIAWVLSNDPYNFNTRSCGITKEYALIPIDEALIFWADDIICVDPLHKAHIEELINTSRWKEDFAVAPNVFLWNLADIYNYRDPRLVEIVQDRARCQYEIKPDIDRVVGGIECGCGYVSPDYAEFCQNCGERLTEV